MNDDKEQKGKKKYAFFSDPDTIAKRAEAATIAKSRFLPANEKKPLTKTHEYQLQPHPFTFITAVKRKLALAAEHEVNKQQQQQQHVPEIISSINIDKLKLSNDKMDFIKPLKVPDMKISPKNMDFSPRLSQKLEKSQKPSLAHRKLDFSHSEGSSFITSDETEQLKAPEVVFSSGISKKKDHTRDASKEKENRTKKIKKDDSKNEDSSDISKRRLIKHTSRKDYDENNHKSKDRLTSNLSRDSDLSDYFSKKSKQKIFSISAMRKDDDKKIRSSSSHSLKSRDGLLEPKSRTYSSESISERNFKFRDGSRGPVNDSIIDKHNDDFLKSRNSLKKQFEQKLRDKSLSSGKNPKNIDDTDREKVCRGKELDKFHQTGSTTTLDSKTDSLDDIFMDPRRISFRDDSYSTQDEFCNLTTPDINLLYRPRKRRDIRIIPEQLQEQSNEKKTPTNGQENSQGVNLRHPTALHMQFQAELHLFDSCNQSLQQVMDVENCLYNVQQEKARELPAIQNFEQQDVEKIPTNDVANSNDEQHRPEQIISGTQFIHKSTDVEPKKQAKEVQTQTANDIATQTEIYSQKKRHPSITYSRGDLNQLSLGSIEEYDDFDDLDKLKKLRTMSEISLHETTSSIKTETGTEISISTRDVTCSFNKFLDLEMAQLIKDEAQMYDKIELLFKSREKTLNDRTRKLVKLEEQKKALRDTGQDSRISSVKKKQRALLLKLQQEKDEMNRLKELHKLASQERKLMLQKQRNMFNPTMSTKNILTKLKRSADCQSPRRLSGPMKGYDIRSNSSISSLVDSDKSHMEKSKQSIAKSLHDSTNSSHIDSSKKFEVRKGKFEEKMPKSDILKSKSHQLELEEKLNQARQIGNVIIDGQEQKSESDTLVEDLSRKKSIDDGDDGSKRTKITQIKLQNIPETKQMQKRKNYKNIKVKSSQNILTENIIRSKSNDEILRWHKRSKNDKDDDDDDENSRIGKNSLLGEFDMNDSQHSIQAIGDGGDDADDDDGDEAVKENFFGDSNDNGDEENVQNLGNISTRSQVSTLTISRHSSGDSEKSFSRSVVIRSQDHRFKAPKKFEQILTAREAQVVARQNCVEDWIAWHARLKAQESRVARMEEAAYELVNASNSAHYNDMTVSSDASDIANRVEQLAEELAEKRAECVKLQKETKKQTKQKLKAMEALLLNKIKKYDTTIHEMKRKIETNRGGSKGHGKLAIEAKAVADVKVPEIPIKRFQELYKCSDLLRSRSESDLLVNYINPSARVTSENTQASERSRKISSRSIESVLSESKNILSTKLSSKSSEIILKDNGISQDEAKKIKNSSTSSKATKLSETTTNSQDNNQQSSVSSKFDFGQLNNKNLDEPISTLKNDLKTLSEMLSNFSKKSDEKLRSVLTSTSEHEETPKSTSRDISEDLLKSQANTEDQETIPGSLSFNKSVDSVSILSEQKSSKIQSNTDNMLSLNLENEKSSEIIGVDVTEVLSGIIPSQESNKVSEEIDFKARSKAMLNEIEKSIILEKSSVNNGGKNIEINESKLEKSMDNFQKEDEVLSSDFNILEGDIQSITEIISKMSETQQTLSEYKRSEKERKESENNKIDTSIVEELKSEKTITENEVGCQETFEDVEQNISIDNQSSIKTFLDDENIEEKIETSELNEAGNESSLESEKISYNENSSKINEIFDNKIDKSKNESDWTNSDSFEVPQDYLKSWSHTEEPQVDLDFQNIENTDESIDKLIVNIGDSLTLQNFDNDIDTSYFLPNCESTSIGIGILSEQNPNLTMEIHENIPETDDLDDILEIIEKDSKKMDLENREKISEGLGKLHQENKKRQTSPELNLTADVEPVLKQLTEVLRSVERNIEKRTQSVESEKTDSPATLKGEETENNSTQEVSPTEKADRKELETKKVVFSDKISFEDENLVETNIDEQREIDKHLDEALDRLSIHEEHEDVKNHMENIKQIELNKEDEIIFKKPANKFSEILRDPEYEDISEESMEVSEILDKSESINSSSRKSSKIVEKFEKIPKTDDVLRILDEISQQKENILPRPPQDLPKLPNISFLSEKSESAVAERSRGLKTNVKINDKIDKDVEEIPDVSQNLDETSDESSEEQETPREVSDLDLDSPRDLQNSSRLDIEALDDNLLSQTSPENAKKLDYHTARGQTTSEKDIENMIEKLRASLDQPGLDVAIIDARLLRIEELQIELQIKKLEAEEVSYYVREIPNKPPPPYTPPGGPKSPSRLHNYPATVIPNNVDELTNFTEKATMFIYHSKQSGNDILTIEAPEDICESRKNDDTIDKTIEKTTKNDKKIYNSFLFDLCKETIADIYQSEYEKPGPSWTKPNFKTKTIVKLPNDVDELNEYVCKEVATLFGFKTKMQRENMVMRWSRKRGDRVDELLAREAQAEEDEWTKFHHDELAVKNELTVAILDTLILETTSVIKAAHAKKRKFLV